MSADWQSAVIFVAALCFTTFGIGVVARYELRPAVPEDITEKIGTLATLPADVDTIGIGSSRMLHEFDPAAIAAASAQADCTIRPYNLGVGGLNGIEMRRLLRWIGEAHPHGLRRIVFDMPNHIFVQFENLGSRRVFVTTDPTETPLALEDIVSHPDPRKLSALLRYAIALAYENSALGAFSPWLAPHATAAAVPAAESPNLGFAPLDAATAAETPERLHLKNNYRHFTELIGQLHRASLTAAAPAVEGLRAQLRGRLAEETIDLIRSLGYEPVLLLLPDTYPQAIEDAAVLEAHVRATRPGITVINLMSARYADTVYEPGAWWDWTHLAAATVERLSTGIGQALCRGPEEREPVVSAVKNAVH